MLIEPAKEDDEETKETLVNTAKQWDEEVIASSRKTVNLILNAASGEREIHDVLNDITHR